MENQQANEQTREKYSINKDGSALLEFKPVVISEYIHSNAFVNAVAAAFKQTFADFYGCLFEVATDGRPYVDFYFDHLDHSNSSLPCACEMVNSNNNGNDVISRARARDAMMKEGDRYYLTEDGKDIFSELLPYYNNKNGKIDWKKYVCESNDPTVMPGQWNQWDKRTQFTAVRFVDINQLAKLLYGDGKKENNPYDYEVAIKTCLEPVNPYQQYNYKPRNYMLQITQVPIKAVQEVFKSMGIVQGSGMITGDN